jgi:hypothetical protein
MCYISVTFVVQLLARINDQQKIKKCQRGTEALIVAMLSKITHYVRPNKEASAASRTFGAQLVVYRISMIKLCLKI